MHTCTTAAKLALLWSCSCASRQSPSQHALLSACFHACINKSYQQIILASLAIRLEHEMQNASPCKPCRFGLQMSCSCSASSVQALVTAGKASDRHARQSTTRPCIQAKLMADLSLPLPHAFQQCPPGPGCRQTHLGNALSLPCAVLGSHTTAMPS